MREDYIKEIPIINLDENQSDMEIIRSIIKSQRELELAHKNYDYAEGDLIDYYSYKIKSEQSKIDYLLRKAKDKKLVLSAINSRKECNKIRLEEAENQI